MYKLVCACVMGIWCMVGENTENRKRGAQTIKTYYVTYDKAKYLKIDLTDVINDIKNGINVDKYNKIYIPIPNDVNDHKRNLAGQETNSWLQKMEETLQKKLKQYTDKIDDDNTSQEMKTKYKTLQELFGSF